jgi:hypothetical protein
MIATVGPCLPNDLLEATGRHAGPLPWRLDRTTPRADQWLESKFPGWAGSILEDWAQGRFDQHSDVVFSRADDAAQRLYYYVCELQRRGLIGGPRPLVFDVAKIPRASSVAHTIEGVRRLAEEFGLDNEALEAGIVATNSKRGAGTEMAPAGRACLLAGTPPPQRLLHDAIAAAGFAPVGATLAEVWADPGPAVEQATGDPAGAIGRQVHRRHDDRRGFGDAARSTLELARRSGAEAAILWYGEEDEVRVWDVPGVRHALTEAGVPLLLMTRRDEAARDGAPAEVRAFLEGLKS